jgi:mannobiose 2-epimerase
MDPGRQEKTETAKELAIYLRDRVMPYWYDTTIDTVNGGYLLADSLYPFRGTRMPWRFRLRLLLFGNSERWNIKTEEKQLASQCRMIFVFSLVHRLGYSGTGRNYLKAAEAGYRFIIEAMLDRQHGGFYWRTDVEGRVLESRRSLYGQAFAIYALVEYHRASGLSAPLDQAFALYRKVQEKLHDEINSGWIEHGDEAFRPLNSLGNRESRSICGMPGRIAMKSSDAHLHWMEALIELYDVTGDASVRSSLTEVLHVSKTFFFLANPFKSCDYMGADWSKVQGNDDDGISYGHIIEFAYLMIRAQRVLQVAPDWCHFDNILMHALKYGFDHKKGGFYWRGFDGRPASDRTKVWWVQAEGMAALTEAIYHEPDTYYDEALDLLVKWIFKYQILSDDGIWIASTTEKGRPIDLAKATSWKAAYHEVRAITKFIHTFSSPGNSYVS